MPTTPSHPLPIPTAFRYSCVFKLPVSLPLPFPTCSPRPPSILVYSVLRLGCVSRSEGLFGHFSTRRWIHFFLCLFALGGWDCRSGGVEGDDATVEETTG